MSIKKLLFCMLSAQVLTLLGFACYAVTLITLQHEWYLSNFQSGLIASSFFFGYIGFVSLATVLTDRFDAKKIYLFGVTVEFIGLIGFALIASGFLSALICMFFIGAGISGTYMPGLKILTDRLKGGEITRYISFYTAFFGLGVGFSYGISGILLKIYDWHFVFGVIALCPVLAGILVYFFIDALSEQKWQGSLHLNWQDVFPLERWKLVWQNKDSSTYILGYVAHSIELFATRSWLVAFFVICATNSSQSFFLNPTEAASVINFIGVPASIIGNEIAIRLGRKNLIYIVMILSAFFGVCLSASIGWQWWLIMTLAIIHNIFIMADSATLTAGLVTSTHESLRGAAMGLHSLMGFGGGLLGPAIFGFVLDVTSGQQNPTSWIWAYVSIVIWGCCFVLYQMQSHKGRTDIE